MKETILSYIINATGRETADIPVGQAAEDIRSGRYRQAVQDVRSAYQFGGKKEAGPLKKQLPAILFSGRFKQRNTGGIEQHSGILVADLDGLAAERIEELRARLKEDLHVLLCFLSPTASGLKVGFRVPADADRHADSFAAVATHVKEKYGEDIDQACKDLARLCFVSHDPDLYVNWEAEEMEVAVQVDAPPPINVDLESQYGQAFYLSQNGGIKTINHRYWAGLYLAENHLLYEPAEARFYEYQEDRGLWQPVTEARLREAIAARLLEFSRDDQNGNFEAKINRPNLDTIIAHLKGLAERADVFNQKKRIVHCANGVLRLQPEGGADFTEFSVADYSRNQSPIGFDKEAQCPRFLNEFIYRSVGEEDALLIQKWMGLALLGDNAPQKFLILDGQSGGGKSTLIDVINSVVGSQNVYQLRTEHLGDRFELFRYIGKTLLIGSDVSGKFLMGRHAHIIKSLVGGDPLSAEGKSSNGDFEIKGNFNIVISCNTRLKVLLEGDIGAWKRRLLIVRYEKEPPKKPIPDFGVQLVEEEGSGILNWALVGLQMALEDINEIGTLRLSEDQIQRVDALLAESESVRHCVEHCFIKDDNGDVTSDEAVQAYAEYCSDRGWHPLPITTAQQQFPDLMLEFFSAPKSHSCKRNGKSVRGWRGVRLTDTAPEHFDL